MNDDFYQKIAGFNAFVELANAEHFRAAPEDWHVVICDVVNSTVAISKGRYKEVNMVGAATIMAILNVADGVDLPYAFGGDGATVLVPSRLVPVVKATLSHVQAKVEAMFDLQLRAGLVPLSALYAQGTTLSVGRFYLSEQMSQAVFHGTALTLAEHWIKKGGGTAILCTKLDADDVNLQGLECRWEPIANRNGMMLSLIVKVLPQFEQQALSIHSKIVTAIGDIYPAESAQPVTPTNTRISFSPKRLRAEMLLRGGPSFFSRFIYLIRMLLLNAIGQFSFSTGKKALGFDGQRYLSELAANSDSRKFDEALRMILDSSEAQREQLAALLERHRTAGEIVYGMHASKEALMTCLVFSLVGNHVHFVDGSDGGYALAAVQMKRQLSELAKERAYG
ncbi:MAG: DUF3095 domain-containing protein [Rickettsiales bacterium]|nr:DUF3095 domain-containing protein [Rickettsiales bacterium]